MPIPMETRIELTQELEGLLSEASKSLAAGGTHAQRMQAFDAIKEFRDRLPRSIRRESTLDEIADEMKALLLHEDRSRSIHELQRIGLEMKRLTTTLNNVTAGANADAASIRLDKVIQAVESTTKTIQELKLLKESLDDGTDAELIANIEKAVKAIQKLRDDLET